MLLSKLIVFFIVVSLGLILPFYFDLSLNSKTDLSKLWFLACSTSFLLLGWLILLLKKKDRESYFIFTPLDIPIFLYISSTFISTLISTNPQISLWGCYMRYQGLLAHINYLLVFYLVVRFFSSFEWSNKILFYILLTSSSLLGIYAYLQFKGIDPINWEVSGGRMTATFGNPVFLGAYLVTIIPLGIALFFATTSNLGKLLILLGTNLSYLGLLLTQTRACFVGFGVAILLFLILTRNLLFRLKTKVLVLSLTLIFTTITGVMLTKGGIVQRITSIVEKKEKEEKEGHFQVLSSPIAFSGTAKLRLLMYKAGIKLLQNFPILGVGVDNIHFVYPKYELLSYIRSTDGYTGVDRVHNEFLDVSIMRGILGGLLYIWLILNVIFLLWKNKKYRFYAAGLASGISAYIIQNQFSLAVVGIALPFWLLLGMSTVLVGKNKKVHIPKVLLILFCIGGILVTSVSTAPLYYADRFYYGGDLHRALKLNPWERTYWGALFGKYIGENKLEGAEAVACEAIKYINSESAFYNFLGVSLQRQGRIDEAIKAYKKAISYKPYFIDALYNLGSLYWRKGELDKAASAFLKAYSAAPRREIYAENALHVLKLAGKWDKAIDFLKDLAKSREVSNQQKEWAYQELANIFWVKKDYRSCQEVCEALLEINPKNIEIRRNLALLYYHYLHNRKKALYHASIVLEYNPQDKIRKNFTSLVGMKNDLK